jgi:hypothetical protein
MKHCCVDVMIPYLIEAVRRSTMFQENVAGPGASCVRAAALQF